MSWDVFIAHAGADDATARSLHGLLSERFRVFLDVESLRPGDEWDVALPSAQRASRMTVVLVSQQVGTSYYLREEIAYAVQLARTAPERHRVVPVYVDGRSPGDPETPYGLRVLHGLNASTLGLGGVAEAIAGWLTDGALAGANDAGAEGLMPPLSARRRMELYRRLARLSSMDFEQAITECSFAPAAATLDLPQATRAIDLLHRLVRSDEVDELETVLAAVERSWLRRAAAAVARLLWRAIPGLQRTLVERGILRAPAELRAVDDYLSAFCDEMTRLNQAGIYATQVVPARAGALDGRAVARGEYGAPLVGPSIHRRVRQVLRILSGLSRGGDQATARLASVHRRSRLVRNVVRVLLRSRAPLILLGDPGSGKSMTLREVGRLLVTRDRRRLRPRVPVYVRLGQWREANVERPGEVLRLIEASIPQAHRGVRQALPMLIAERRLVVLFDGMDEMERERYVRRVSALSEFAGRHQRRIKTLFACRINDFSPEFEHRQMVLLPFDRSQIREFVRYNAQHPLAVDGMAYSDRRFVAVLHQRPVVRELVSNPLLLFLVCHFIGETGHWPASRAALFDLFLETLLRRLSVRESGESLEAPETGPTVAAWAHLAFAITRPGGTEMPREAAEALGAWATAALERGVRSGLLLLDPDTDAIRFVHHRVQEYLTARHLAVARPQVDWPALLDSPRWQETLVSLAAIDPDAAGLDALAEVLAWPEPPAAEKEETAPEETALPAEAEKEQAVAATDKPQLAADVERQLADRAVLASEVLREAGAERGGASRSLAERLAPVIERLSSEGRPTSKVKMLWAWRNVPDLLPFAALRHQLVSGVDWVREQAILLVGSLDEIDPRAGRDLGIELAVDLAAGKVLQRLPTFLRAAGQRSGPAWYTLLAWASLCQLVLLAAAFLLALDLLLRMVERFPIVALEPPRDALAATVALLAASLVFRRSDVHPGRIAVYAAGALAFVQVLVSSLQFEVSFVALSDAVISAVPSLLWVLLLLVALHWAVVLVFLAPLATVRGRGWFRSACAAVGTDEGWLNDVVVAVVALIPLAGYLVIWLLESLRDWFGWFGILFMAAAILFTMVAVVGWVIAQVKRRDLKATLKEAGAIVLLGGGFSAVMVGVLSTADALEQNPSWLDRLLLVVSSVLAPAILGAFAFRFGHRLLLSFYGRNLRLEEWQRAVAGSAPWRQYLYLHHVRRHDLGAEPAAFLAVLEALEEKVRSEPAATEYWRLRYSLEQTLRQERAEEQGDFEQPRGLDHSS